MSKKVILLISYVFPPYPGIGGRRWAKFSKYLSNIGYEVNVIHAENTFNDSSLWASDVKSPDIICYPIKSFYPTILSVYPKTLIQKLNYRFSLFYVRVLSKGTPYDKGIFWNSKMLQLANQLIQKKEITNVIVSCAPFSTGYESLKLKKKYPKLNLIIDFRDPWTWRPGYGFKNLSEKRTLFEKRMEKLTIEKANKILVPVDVMKKHLDSTYPDCSGKIAVLPHGFDVDEIQTKKKKETDMIRFIFYGNLYEDIENYLEQLTKVMSSVNIRLDIYSETTRYAEIFLKADLMDKKVFYHLPLLTTQLFHQIASADFVLLIHPDRGIDNISTKFYEIIQARTPIIYIAKPGATSQFVVKNKVGYFFTLQETEMGLTKLLQGELPYNFNSNFDVSNYSFEALTYLLIKNHFKNDR